MTQLLVYHMAVCAVLAVLVTVVCRLGRLRPALCHLLWLMVLVKLTVPPLVSWPWALPDIANLLPKANSPAVSTPFPVSTAPASNGPVKWLRLIGETPSADERPIEMGATPAITPLRAACALWVLGSVTLFTVQMIRLLRFARRIRAGLAAPDWLKAHVDDLSRAFGLTAPGVVVLPGIRSSYVWGFGRARLLIPEDSVGALEPARWRGIVAHELAHLKRRDQWVGVLELLSGCIWWWNPVFWYVRRRLHAQAELACDAWVVWALPEQRREYAEALVGVMELEPEKPTLAPVLGMGSGAMAAIERRLTMILREQIPCGVPRVVLAMAFALVVAAIPGWSQESAPAFPDIPSATPAATAPTAPDAAPKEATRVEKSLDSTVNIEFENTHLSEITDFLSASYDVNIMLDYRAILPPPVKAAAAGLGTVRGGAPAEALEKLPTDGTEAFDAARRGTGAPTGGRDAGRLEGAPPSERAAGLRSSGASESSAATVSNGRIVTDGMLPHVALENISLRDALTALLRPLNLTFRPEPNVIWISSPALIAADDALPKPSRTLPDESALGKALKSSVNINFENVHILEITEFLKGSYDVNIVLDSRVVAPPKGNVTEKKVGSPGYVTDGMLRFVKLENISLGEALDVILRTLDLTYKPDTSFIWISSPALIEKEPLPAEAAAGTTPKA